MINKKADVVRVYLLPDANTLLSVADHCLRSRDYVNVIVAGKQPVLQFLTMGEAVKHCTAGISIWKWASGDAGSEPEVVRACAGEVPTMEILAAVDLLRQHLPELRVRVAGVRSPDPALRFAAGSPERARPTRVVAGRVTAST